MCLKRFLSPIVATVFAVGSVAFGFRPVAAEELRLGRAPDLLPAISAFSSSTFTIGYLTPAFGALSLRMSPVTPASVRTVNGLGQTFDVGGTYTKPVSVLGQAGGRVGVFGAYDAHLSILALTPATSWNFGASVGYAGFYVRGGVNESAAVGPLLGIQGLEAGLGYEVGSLDLRVTFLTAQAVGVAQGEIDSRQWAIGGIYQITPTIRLNADAFYGDVHGAALAISPPLASPPGTGARVGVALRF